MTDLTRLNNALSSVHRAWCFYEQTDSVVALLSKNLPHIDPSTWHARLAWGGVYVNGRAARFDYSPFPPFKLEYFEPKFDFQSPEQFFPVFSKEWIIYEDEWLIIACKPQGIACLPTREQRCVNLKSYLDTYVGSPIHMPSRLDTSTTGLVVVSKNPSSHRGLQMLFQKREIKKRYLFETASEVSWQEITVDEPIGKDRIHPILRKVINDDTSKPAITHFKKISSTLEGTLIEATPKTGRTHQIRVHASHLGIPIIGDNFYGGLEAKGLRLFSYELEFHHPITGKLVLVRAPESDWPKWCVTVGESLHLLNGHPERAIATEGPRVL